MKINHIFLLLAFLVCISSGRLVAQSIDLSVMPIYGSYDMTNMKTYQDEQAGNIYDSLGTYPKKMYDFPPYWGLNINAGFNKNRHQFSLTLNYNTTGGRLSYSDYSGIIKIDKLVNCKGISGGYSFAIIQSEKIQTLLGFEVGVNFSTLKEENIVAIYISDEETNEVNKYRSQQITLIPEVSIAYFPIKNIFIKVSAGYSRQISTSKQLNKEPNQKLELVDESGKDVTLDWSGFRLGAGIGYRFNSSK